MVNRSQRAGEVERVLSSLYSQFFNQIKKNKAYPWDMVALRKEFEQKVYTTTRKAVTEIYTTGTSYVGSKFKEDVYPSDTDLLNIKSETDRTVRSFWFQIQEDSKRSREQEVEEESKKKDRQTESLLGTVAGIAVTAGLAVGTFSKTSQLKQDQPPGEEEKKPKLVWRSMLDEKTCQVLPNGNPGCGDLDGTEWDYDDVNIPVPGRLGPNGTHPNCRCQLDLIME